MDYGERRWISRWKTMKFINFLLTVGIIDADTAAAMCLRVDPNDDMTAMFIPEPKHRYYRR